MDPKRPIPRMFAPSALAVALVTSGACSPTGSFKITAMPSDLSLEERIIVRHPGWGSDRIAVIDIAGVLMNSREMGLLSEGEHAVSFVVEKLHKAAADKRVKAIVLRINSPGGTVTASDILYEEIRTLKKRTGKPVVAYFQDVAASGAYYLACATDEIVAQRTCVTGSIGVIMQMVNLSGTMMKLGITTDAITSGPLKDAGSPLRPMKDDERQLFQEMVDDFYAQFVEVVDTGRPKLSREEVAKLADGRVYIANKALEVGLIDRIGTIRQAVDIAKARAGVEAAHVVLYHRPLAWSPNIYSRTQAQDVPTVNIMNINLPNSWTRQPSFMYIWHVWE